MRFASADAVPADRPMKEVGLDSLMAVELRDRLRVRLATTLPSTFFVTHPSPAAVATLLAPALFGDATDLVADRPMVVLDASSFEEDAVLPADLVPERVSIRPRHDPPTIFLTGATGFLGAFLLHEFLSSGARAVCHVRAASPAEGLARVLANLRKYGLPLPEAPERLSIVCGDLGRPRLGLTPEDFRAVAEGADLICHNGALVNWVMSYDDLRGPNVLGTREVIRLSCVRGTPLHFVSSMGVFSTLGQRRSEEDEPDSPRDLRTGYTQSKAVGERLVRAAGARGLPVAIHLAGAHHGQ